MAEDVTAIARDLGLTGDIRFTRLVVTERQIDEYGLPTAPAKETDKRRFEGETVQAEALPPDVLAAIVRTAIDSRIDAKALNAVLAEEADARDWLSRQLQPLLDGVA